MTKLEAFQQTLYNILDQRGYEGSVEVFQQIEQQRFIYDRAMLVNLRNDLTEQLTGMTANAYVARVKSFIDLLGKTPQQHNKGKNS